MTTFKPGDLVVVESPNNGQRAAPRKNIVATWAGKIIGPSLMGEGWWLVRRIDPHTGRTMKNDSPSTVPERELSK